jgi:hypothetical protein
MVNTDIFLGSGATLAFVPEVIFSDYIDESESTTTLVTMLDANSADIELVPNLYKGCIVELFDNSTSTSSLHTITKNTTTTFTFTPAQEFAGGFQADSDYFHIHPYGTPCPAKRVGSNSVKLNADNWLGIVESAEFPNVEVEVKPLNLSLGGSRNITHQYKGIETASGGNINLVANHGAWLYYALGTCTGVKLTSASSSTVPAQMTLAQSGTTYQVYYDTVDTLITDWEGSFERGHLNQGPIFYRSANDETLMPPVVIGSDIHTNLNKLTVSTYASGTIDEAITYEFGEANGVDLPSFSLEHSMTKTSAITVTDGTATETESIVRIARGNRVESLNMTANENEEVKMTMDLNTRTVDFINDLTTTEVYTPRNGQGTNTSLFNYNSNAEAVAPFFFSSGLFSCFGQTFLKVTNLSLTITNNLQDKRFIGVGNKSIKDAIPSNRMYEIAFTAIVTDDKLFQELLNNDEDTGSGNQIVLQFDKDSGEQILLNFQDYFLEAAKATIPDDKGAITFEGTVKPRTMSKCEVKTHWVLQG